jgi:catechol 2,3-dioxygenase-like lactoylglutathione lyase family enzyme
MTEMSPALVARLGELTLDLPAPRLSEIVLRTSHYEAMKAWYQAALSVKPIYEYVPPDWDAQRLRKQEKLDPEIRLCFLRVHTDYPYTQVIAIFDVPDLAPSETSNGLHHLQLRHQSIDALLLRYERLRAAGITPYKTFNHGPATSFYYEDFDGNLVEFSAVNFPTEGGYLGYFRTEAYRRNPGGVPIDADALLARRRAGEELADLTRMPE